MQARFRRWEVLNHRLSKTKLQCRCHGASLDWPWISCSSVVVSLLHEAVAPLIEAAVPDGVEAPVLVAVVLEAVVRDEVGWLNREALCLVVCTVFAGPKEVVLVAPEVVALVVEVAALVVEAAALAAEYFSQAGVDVLALVVLALIVLGVVAPGEAGASVGGWS